MALSASSSAHQARQALAKRLADLCRQAGLTGLDLAERCGWSRSKSSRIMNAKTPPSAEDIRAWCRACGAEEQTEDLIASLRMAEGMWVDWRRMERAGLRQAQEARLPLYRRTRRFRSYSSWLVPGLIQTQSYTTAALRAVQRRRGLVDDVADAVAARMERQRVLYEGGRRFAFLVEESVLRNGIGGAEVMSEQLGHLILDSHEWPAAGVRSETTLSPDDVGEWVHMFAIGVQVPDLFCRVDWGKDGAYRMWLMDTGVTSWATADYEKGRTAYPVVQCGPRKLWQELETAWRWWDQQDRPGFDRFGLTVNDDGERVWLDSPDRTVPLRTT